MMWMPLRSVRMKRLTFGFHRRVWCPKCTPLSSSWRMVTTAMAVLLLAGTAEPCCIFSVVSIPPGGRHPWCPDAIPHNRFGLGLMGGRPPRRNGAEGTRSHFRGGSAGFSVAAEAVADYAGALPDDPAPEKYR